MIVTGLVHIVPHDSPESVDTPDIGSPLICVLLALINLPGVRITDCREGTMLLWRPYLSHSDMVQQEPAVSTSRMGAVIVSPYDIPPSVETIGLGAIHTVLQPLRFIAGHGTGILDGRVGTLVQ